MLAEDLVAGHVEGIVKQGVLVEAVAAVGDVHAHVVGIGRVAAQALALAVAAVHLQAPHLQRRVVVGARHGAAQAMAAALPLLVLLGGQGSRGASLSLVSTTKSASASTRSKGRQLSPE